MNQASGQSVARIVDQVKESKCSFSMIFNYSSNETDWEDLLDRNEGILHTVIVDGLLLGIHLDCTVKCFHGYVLETRHV